jgi:phosphatidylinositol alpha 1,6-mannosyltransferase
VPPGDAGALADAARALADDAALRARLGAGARARVAGRFTLDAIADEWVAAYREASLARGLNAEGRRGHLPHDRA